MKKIFLYVVLIISIPFFVVNILNNAVYDYKNIDLKHVSNIVIRIKENDGSIKSVFLEDYLVGVLGGEMPASFEVEALKAQCVASRTYVLKKNLNNINNEYDVSDSIYDQVYLNDDDLRQKWGKDYSFYVDKLRKIVADTSMEYLEYNGDIIDALFFSTSNGYTEDSGVVFSNSLPYLKSVKSVWDEEVASAFSFNTSISLQEFYEKLGLSYSDKLVVDVLDRSDTNRILKLKINGVEISGKDIYNKLKLRSLDFNLVQVGNNVDIETKGYGHGVGMSQYGAQGMAKHGYNYKEILEYYYNGIEIKKISNN